MAHFDTITDGLLDNARNNDVPLNDGWTAEGAIDTYLSESDILALSGAEYDALSTQVAAFLAA
jgi:hypothetical protein